MSAPCSQSPWIVSCALPLPWIVQDAGPARRPADHRSLLVVRRAARRVASAGSANVAVGPRIGHAVGDLERRVGRDPGNRGVEPAPARNRHDGGGLLDRRQDPLVVAARADLGEEAEMIGGGDRALRRRPDEAEAAVLRMDQEVGARLDRGREAAAEPDPERGRIEPVRHRAPQHFAHRDRQLPFVRRDPVIAERNRAARGRREQRDVAPGRIEGEARPRGAVGDRRRGNDREALQPPDEHAEMRDVVPAARLRAAPEIGGVRELVERRVRV